MTPAFLFRIVVLNTFKKRLRALLVIGGVAITSAALIVLFGISTGLHALVMHEVERSDSRDVITVDQRNVSQILLNDETAAKIKSIAGVNDTQQSVGLLGDATYHGISMSMPIYGVSENYFALSPNRFASGSPLGANPTDIVISTKVAHAFALSPSDAIGRPVTADVTLNAPYLKPELGETKRTPPAEYRIVGVIDKGETPLAYLPIEGLRAHGLVGMSELKLRINTPARAAEIRETIEQLGFQTSSIQDTIAQITKVFTIIQRTLVLFSIILLFITISGTFSIISLTLMEEIRQIGFLRISGLRNAFVMLMFTAQSILLTTSGAVCGIALGLILGFGMNGLAQSAALGTKFGQNVIIFRVPLAQITTVLILSLIVGWIVGLFPARRAVRMTPLQELLQ